MTALIHVTTPSLGLVEASFAAGFEGVVIDLQHGEIGTDDACTLIRQIPGERLSGVWVRVAAIDSGVIGRLLDAGARAIIAPTVESAAEAAALVAAVKYPPVGRRSLGPSRTGVYEGAGDPRRANDWVRAVAQIESRAGVEAVAEVVNVLGLDSIYLGPADLAFSYGHPISDMLGPDSPLRSDLLAVLEAARSAGLTVGTFAIDEANAAGLIADGVLDYAALSVDVGLFAAAARTKISSFRSYS